MPYTVEQFNAIGSILPYFTLHVNTTGLTLRNTFPAQLRPIVCIPTLFVIHSFDHKGVSPK